MSGKRRYGELHQAKRAPRRFQGQMPSDEKERAKNIWMANTALNKEVTVNACYVWALCDP